MQNSGGPPQLLCQRKMPTRLLWRSGYCSPLLSAPTKAKHMNSHIRRWNVIAGEQRPAHTKRLRIGFVLMLGSDKPQLSSSGQERYLAKPPVTSRFAPEIFEPARR